MPFSFKPPQESDLKSAATTPPSSTTSSAGAAPVKAYVPPIAPPTAFDSRYEQEGRGLIQIVLLFAFWGALVATVIIFGWKYLLNSKIEAKKEQLAAFETKLGKLPLDEMKSGDVQAI